MSQHDYVIANGTGAAVRSDLNNALAAIVSNNSGATEPATMYAYQWWADTSTGLLKLRNAANNAWITLRELDGTLTIEAGTVSAPGLAFASDLNTGVFSAGADQLAIATNGVERVEWGTSEVVFNDGGTNYDFRIEGDTVDSLFFVDASTDRVGLGTSSPASKLNVSGTQGNYRVDPDSVTNEIQLLTTVPDNSGFRNYRVRSNQIFLETSGSNALTIDTSQRVGIGTTSPTRRLTVSDTTTDPFITIAGAASNEGGLLFGDNASDASGQIRYNHAADAMWFSTNLTERARIDSSGRLLVGTSTNNSTYNSRLQVKSDNSTAGGALIDHYENDTTGAALFLAKSRSATVGTMTVVQNGDTLGVIRFDGADGTQHRTGARIECQVDGTPGANDMPGRLVFSTTADGASSPTERMRITSNNLIICEAKIWTKQGVYASSSGADNTRIFDSSFGTGSTTLYIGNAAIQVSSDIRLKKDIEDTKLNALEVINQIKVKDFTWDDPTDISFNNRNARGKWTGLIAQELVEILPFVVNAPRKEEDKSIDYESEERWTIDQSQLCPVLIRAVQQQQEIIAGLEARLSALEAQ